MFRAVVDVALAVDKTLNWRDNSGNNPLVNDQESGFYIMQRIGPNMAGWTILGITEPNTTTYRVILPDDYTNQDRTTC